jgi:hypothetical protein
MANFVELAVKLGASAGAEGRKDGVLERGRTSRLDGSTESGLDL